MKKIGLVFLCLMVFLSFFLIQSVEAAKDQNPKPAVRENFNKYTNGSIVGQGGWVNRANGLLYVVQDVIKKEGKKALYNNNPGSDSVITKVGSSLTDGRQSIYFRSENRTNWQDRDINMGIRISKDGWDSPSRIVVGIKKDGHIAYNDLFTPWVDFGTYTDNDWNLVDIEWRSVDTTARYRINNGTWTDWIPFHGGSEFTNFNTVGFETFLLGTGGVYVDDLQ